MKTIGVTDLYEAAFLVYNGCALKGVECIPLAKVLGCRMAFEASEDLEFFQEQFRRREATVNLYDFRTAYNQVNGYVHQTKKNHEQSQRRAEPEASAPGGGDAIGDGEL